MYHIKKPYRPTTWNFTDTSPASIKTSNMYYKNNITIQESDIYLHKFLHKFRYYPKGK